MKVSERVNSRASDNLKNRAVVKAKAQQGFTLIELVIVVVILGFLAVTAIPKFLDLTDQAKQANIEGMAGGFATGVSLTRAQWEAEGRPTVNNINSVDYDGTTLVLTTPPNPNNDNIRPGYPTGTDEANSDGTAMNTTRCIQVWQGIYSQPPSITASVSETGGLNDPDEEFDYFVNVLNNLCVFYLKETLDKNGSGNFADPAGANTVGNSFTYNSASSEVIVYINN